MTDEAELHAVVKRVVGQLMQSGGTAAPEPGPKETEKSPRPGPPPQQTQRGAVAIGADHGGYALKEILKQHLENRGFNVIDCGTHSTDPVDYPDFARAVAVLVGQGKAWRGVMIDGAGIGSCMAANKISGVRASMCYDHATAHNAREHNDANVLTLGAGLLGEALARQVLDVWLDTPFGGGRHGKRVDKIMEIERNKG